MAEPAMFGEANLVLGPPAGSEPGDVVALPVRRLEGRLVSCWRPTLEEIHEIIETGCIWLSVWGRDTQPPVLVTGHKAEVI